MQRLSDIGPRRLQELAAHGVLRGERDGVEDTVETAPALVELTGHPVQMARIGDVELQDVGRIRKPLGDALGDAQRAAEAGQHDLRALFLGQPRDAERDRCVVEDTRDEQALAVEQHDVPSRLWSGPPRSLRQVVVTVSGTQRPFQ
jgi:hypothetical protein